MFKLPPEALARDLMGRPAVYPRLRHLAYAAGMLHQFACLRRRLDTSIWLIPAMFCLVSLVLGMLMLWLDRTVAYRFTSLQMFSMPVDSARQVLSVIAGSVISVGGVSFSVTMVALTLTSGQYGPKVLRHFLEDNDSKISLGLFLGAYVYALAGLAEESRADNRSHDVIAWRRRARGHKPRLVAHPGSGYVHSIDHAGLVRGARNTTVACRCACAPEILWPAAAASSRSTGVRRTISKPPSRH